MVATAALHSHRLWGTTGSYGKHGSYIGGQVDESMKDGQLSSDEKNFLKLITQNIWKARREGAIAGCLYTLASLVLLYLGFMSLGSLNAVTGLCLLGTAAIAFDACRRIFKAP